MFLWKKWGAKKHARDKKGGFNEDSCLVRLWQSVRRWCVMERYVTMTSFCRRNEHYSLCLFIHLPIEHPSYSLPPSVHPSRLHPGIAMLQLTHNEGICIWSQAFFFPAYLTACVLSLVLPLCGYACIWGWVGGWVREGRGVVGSLTVTAEVSFFMLIEDGRI